MTGEHLLVDGYNVIFRTPRLRELAEDSLERARDELRRWLEEAYRHRRRERVTLVFDGERDPMHIGRARRGPVQVLFSRPPESADDVIRTLVDSERRRAAGRRRLACRVVTGDREVAGHARRAGCRATEVESFLGELRKLRAMQSAAYEGPAGDERSASPPGAPPSGRDRARGSGPDRAPPPAPPDPGAAAKPRSSKREIDELERLFAEQQPPDDAEG